MSLKYTNNEMADNFLQNENLQTAKYIGDYNSNMDNSKSSSRGIKCGLSEVSNNKTYLETELPARKRFKPETGLFNVTKNLNIIYKAVGINDNRIEELYESNFEKKSENDFSKSLGCDEISNQSTESEFDNEINKCCELLNLDVLKTVVVNDKSELSNLNDKHPYSNETVTNSKGMLNDENINLNTTSSGKNLKVQKELLTIEEKGCEDDIKLRGEGDSVLSNTVTSNSFSTTCKENCNSVKDEFSHDEIIVTTKYDNSFELECKFGKNSSNHKISNILNDNNVREQNIQTPEVIQQNHDSKSNMEHLNSAIQDTLMSDTIKSKMTKQEMISHGHLHDNKDEIDEISPAVNDPDVLSLYYESSDFDETIEEIVKTCESEPASKILKEKSEKDVTIFHSNLDYDSKNSTNTINETESSGSFIFNGNVDLVDENNPQDNNKCNENKTDFDDKVHESFVSEYEISLLLDSDEMLSEDSLDSEYEVSLLEDDINVEEDQNQNKNADIRIKSVPLENTYDNNQKEDSQMYSTIQSSEATSGSTVQNLTNGKLIQNIDQLTTLTSDCRDSIQIKSKPLENTNNINFQIKYLVTTNEYLVDTACTDISIAEKIAKREPGQSDKGESKENSSDKVQSSNEAIIKDTMNKTKKSEEKSLISTKQNIKSISFNRDCLIKIEETEQEVLPTSASKKNLNDNTYKTNTSNDKSAIEINLGSQPIQDVNIIPDYFEEEKEDLINPGWDKVKDLSTDEQRYRQVRDCWESVSIPNPFKNLTYYSYRKHKINSRGMSIRQTRQHKRQASNNLNEAGAKRSRSCTYIFDDRIKYIEKEKEKEAKTIQEEMFNEVSRLNEQHYQQEMGVQNYYGFGFNPRRQFELGSLEREYQKRIASVTAKYDQKVYEHCDQYTSEIDRLKKNRNEVLQFYSFYKGLNQNEIKDPTVLTNAQMQALEEIENIYNVMDLHYR